MNDKEGFDPVVDLRTVVLVEGISDQFAIEALAEKQCPGRDSNPHAPKGRRV